MRNTRGNDEDSVTVDMPETLDQSLTADALDSQQDLVPQHSVDEAKVRQLSQGNDNDAIAGVP